MATNEDDYLAGQDYRRTADSPPIRIAVCLSHFHPTVGGAERQLFQLARRWARWGHTPVVLTRRLPELPKEESIDGVRILRVIHTIDVGPLFGLSFVATLVASLVHHRRHYDAILAGQAPWEAVATGIASQMLRKPSVVRLANTGPFGDLQQLRQTKGSTLLSAVVRRNRGFLALSEHAEQELGSFGIPTENIWRTTNGVDIGEFASNAPSSPERDRTVLFVGRLAPQKDPQRLLQAWQQVDQTGQYRLLIAGSGPLEAELRRECSERKLVKVEFLGQCHDMPSVYRRAGTMVLPSLSEGCSNALLEAMASGLCPVVTSIGGNTDVIRDGVNGRLVPASDASRLAEALTEVLGNPALRERLADAARKHVVEHHDLERVAHNYLAVFAALQGQQGKCL